MHSLYRALLAQHPRQLTPVRCAQSTISQLHRYFEDVVLENSLRALVIESLPSSSDRSAREVRRVKELSRATESCFLLVTPEDTLAELMIARGRDNEKPVLLERTDQGWAGERFVVIADARFSALLASAPLEDDREDMRTDLVIWTFEPDVVYSALEYLMARVTAEHPFHASAFANAVSVSMPKATSLQLTLGVTTKLARLLHEQAEREIAVNRIATAIRSSLDLDSILQTAANEVGRALSVKYCAVRVQGETVTKEMTRSFPPESNDHKPLGDLEAISARLQAAPKTRILDGDHKPLESEYAEAIVPLINMTSFVGFLVVRTDDPFRVWSESELMLLHTVAEQLAVAVNQAHLFAEMQALALTDSLTGCYNRRFFDMQLERDIRLATRMRQPMSLLMLDLDDFKNINDRAGHSAGDMALRLIADGFRTELRAVDTAVRFGGDEFAVILPQASTEGAFIVAERLRGLLAKTEVPGFGHMTASIGLATFPGHASSPETLVVAADRALYDSKHSGGDRVSAPSSVVPDEDLIESLQKS